MKILHLTLKKKWFDMILSGEKTEEYRDIKPYWTDRLFKDYTHVKFRNGYSKNAPSFIAEIKHIVHWMPNPKWCDDASRPVYILKLGHISSMQHSTISSCKK